MRQFLENLIFGSEEQTDPKRGRLLLETLEQRQLMAGDLELLFTDGVPDTSDQAAETDGLQAAGQGEGELAPDLVQFAKDLVDAGVQFFGAEWCPACTAQKELFQDGKNDLGFIEVTNPDRTLNSIGIAENIAQFPTWDFPDGTRVVGLQTLEQLSALSGVAIPQSETPTFETVGDQIVNIGSPLHIPIDAFDPDDENLTVTVTVDDPNLLEAVVLSGNRSIRIDMEGYGDMVFELFEGRAPRAAGRVADLAEDGFYDGIIFHRVVDDFVIQAGDPTGTGTSGSDLGTFDDDFHPDLQHNRDGILSFAKSNDDTNNSQFFVTEVPTRFLDFNHSIFGQLVEGFDVREAISETATGAGDKPINDVTIDTIEVFDDTENSVVMLKATGNGVGTTNVTFTVTDEDGNSFSETVEVTVGNDNANSQPYLEDVAAQPTTPTNTVAQLQLESFDVEGDPVQYFAQSLSPGNASVTVDSSTGLLTVTPATNFSGTVDIMVGVAFADGVTGNSSSDIDTQTIPFTFAGGSVVTIDLLSGSDSGSSDTDNITNEGSLSFEINGVTDGATVQLIDDATDAVIGTAVASGTSVVITTSNIAALGDGSYTLTARQTVGNTTGDLSGDLTITYDTTDPDSVTGSALTQANVDSNYFSDLVSSEEGSGLTYQFTSAPTGATINATTGVINWTPTGAQLGSNTFTLELTDAAGNVRTESFDVDVAQAPVAEIRLELTDLQGNPISAIEVGQDFLLNFIAVDTRQLSFDRAGVFGAFADILFDSNLIRPQPGSVVDYESLFSSVQKGTFSDGLIDELGAVASSTTPTNTEENLVATIRMEALASGTVNIRSEPADDVNSEFLLYGIDDTIPASAVAYGSVSLAIGQSFVVADDAFDVAEDSGENVLDVLDNDTVVSGNGSLTVVSATQPASGGTVTVENGVLSFRPNDDFNGQAIFTYRVSDSGGVQENATVTVTVTPVNDPPVGNDDTLNVNENTTDNVLNVLQNDETSPDTNETLTITAIGTTSNGGTLDITIGGGSLVYTPAADFTGTETFTYTVSDGDLEEVVTVNVIVTPADEPPTAADDAFVIAEDTPETDYTVLANDTRDVDNQTFELDSVGVPSAGGSVRISDDGTQFLYAPAPDFNGTEQVTYTIRDSGGGIAVGTVTFTVTADNDAPPAIDLTSNVGRDTTQQQIFGLS
ncbi:MAG: Ig-like domain-containing protein, partial [Rubripirellula sp.]